LEGLVACLPAKFLQLPVNSIPTVSRKHIVITSWKTS